MDVHVSKAKITGPGERGVMKFGEKVMVFGSISEWNTDDTDKTDFHGLLKPDLIYSLLMLLQRS